MARATVALGRIERFFQGGGFPALALSLVLGYELLLLTLLVTPPAPGGLGAFAEEFRIWCFGYDPATGSIAWMYAVGMLGPPLFLAGLVSLLWWESLRALLARPRELLRYVALSGVLVLAAGGGLAAIGSSSAQGELPFPAEALRTAQSSPELRLVNQAGQLVDLAQQRGRVVLLTAVYASCPHTCPLILAQARRVIDGLESEAREDLRLVAVTLDPKHDSPQVLAELARRQRLEAPLYNLVSGPPAEVELVLDAIGVSRSRNSTTGVIDHANLFVLVDRNGKVAYRLTLGERQERWLGSALRLLLAEAPPA